MYRRLDKILVMILIGSMLWLRGGCLPPYLEALYDRKDYGDAVDEFVKAYDGFIHCNTIHNSKPYAEEVYI